MKNVWGLILLLVIACQPSDGPYIFSERGVPDYQLPPLLQQEDGSLITTTTEWEERRAELLAVFQSEIYGFTPGQGLIDSLSLENQEISWQALDGQAIREQFRLQMWRGGLSHSFDLLIYRPKQASGPVPVFLGLNFSGNQTITSDSDIWMPQAWVRNDSSLGIFENQATESSRGGFASRWPVEQILAHGYGLATVYCSDLVPDRPSGFSQGYYPLFYRAGQLKPDSLQWGAIGAWAWGLSQIMDFLETQPSLNSNQVALIGHSRLGKTALLAAALDQRFAMVVSNNSGCAGAALFRRRFGETIDAINDIAPHWFNDRFQTYRHQEDSLPVDQHQFLALIAPRPLYVASADQDLWTDPRGEYLSAYHASEVYELYGFEALNKEKSPKPNQPRNSGRVAYHLRKGKHDLTLYDWEQYLSFADRHL